MRDKIARNTSTELDPQLQTYTRDTDRPDEFSDISFTGGRGLTGWGRAGIAALGAVPMGIAAGSLGLDTKMGLRGRGALITGASALAGAAIGAGLMDLLISRPQAVSQRRALHAEQAVYDRAQKYLELHPNTSSVSTLQRPGIPKAERLLGIGLPIGSLLGRVRQTKQLKNYKGYAARRMDIYE